MWTLKLSKAGSGVVDVRSLTGGSMTIGRGGDADWVLADPDRQLSKLHCRVGVEGGSVRVTDISANGTFLNGERERLPADRPVPLQIGDRLRLHNYVIEIESASGPVARHDAIADAISPLGDMDRIRMRAEDIAPSWENEADWAAGKASARADPFALPPGRKTSFEDDLWGARRESDDWPATDRREDGGPRIPGSLREAMLRPLLTEPHLVAERMEIPTRWQEWEGEPAPPAPQLVADPAPEAPAMEAPPEPRSSKSKGYEEGYAAGLEAARKAFLEGAELDGGKLASTPPLDLLGMAGQAYVQSILGLADLLRDRDSAKNAYRMERTEWGRAQTNPLKIVPPREAAHMLLNADADGFMRAREALNAAFQDLKKHQLALLSGMRSALRVTLEQFAPTRLEAKTEKGWPPFGAGRRARSWDNYVAAYAKFAEAAEDDRHGLLNRAFIRGYEEQLSKLDVLTAVAGAGGQETPPSAGRQVQR